MQRKPDAEPQSPRDDAIRLLARREYSRAELHSRLAAKGHEVAAIEACLDGLAEQNLQCDARFAETFVRSRIARGQGPLKIRAELGQRGIDRDGIQQAMSESEDRGEADWFALAADVLAKRFTGPGESPRERARRERFLASRGFDFEQVRHAMQYAWSA
ncbi:regulatory protein RecX [Franzmannia qiaohouensis]|uniref:Regulatory protein RecX n=1 Tax=Franzmannia qiaohouensis TaxID=1329370 RepID=A0ABU1HFY5_9GAMM|nr:regulatory protein RecX [Halomonas qiaohouensis]MDR5906388.1 regulatory protein RecX [Halomonas qiaohouensis]